LTECKILVFVCVHFVGVEKTFSAVADLPETACYYTGQASQRVRQKLSWMCCCTGSAFCDNCIIL